MIRQLVRRAGVVAAALSAAFALSPAGAASASAAWTTGALPVPAGWSALSLNAVECPSTGLCVIVGTVQRDRDHELVASAPVAVVRRAGTFSLSLLPLPLDRATRAQLGELSSISCATAGRCHAVGTYTDYSGRSKPLIETYANGSWTAQTLSTSGTFLDEVACNRATCLATGNRFSDPFTVPTVAVWTAGRGWADRTPSVYFGAQLLHPACTPGTGPCVLEQLPYIYAFPTASALMRWTGTGWTTEPLATASGEATSLVLGTMACPAADLCTAVASYQVDASTFRLAAVDWTLSAAPTVVDVPAAGARLGGHSDGVRNGQAACAAADDCIGVGSFDYSPGTDPVAYERSAGSWTARSAPLPADSGRTDAGFFDASCSSLGLCAAVGEAPVAGVGSAVADVRGTSRWHSSALATPGGGPSQLDAVSCVARQCLAVGANHTGSFWAAYG